MTDVLLSADLLPRVFASLELADCAAASVCAAWGRAWSDRVARVLRAAPLAAPDFELGCPQFLAALPGERLAIATSHPYRVCIVDKEMRLQHTLGDPASGITLYDVRGLAAGDDGLYVAESVWLRRFDLPTFAVAAERAGGEHGGFFELALAPDGVLFVVALRDDEDDDDDDDDLTWELLALDALSLEVRFTVGEDVLGKGVLQGLAVCGDEVYVGNQDDRSIRVLSLSGEPRRVISSQPGGWRMPDLLCCVAGRLYLVEEGETPMETVCQSFPNSPLLHYLFAEDEEEAEAKRPTGRRIFVLTPEGCTLRVHTSPRPLRILIIRFHILKLVILIHKFLSHKPIWEKQLFYLWLQKPKTIFGLVISSRLLFLSASAFPFTCPQSTFIGHCAD